MINVKNIKVGIAALLLSSLMQSHAALQVSHNYKTFSIIAALNKARQKAVIKDVQQTIEVAPTNQASRLSDSVQVPFVSINNYMKQYVNNTPYTPVNALKIHTQLGLFRLWQNESGLICAPDVQKDKYNEEWSADLVLTNENKQHQLWMLKILLSIDENGKLSFKRLKNQ